MLKQINFYFFTKNIFSIFTFLQNNNLYLYPYLSFIFISIDGEIFIKKNFKNILFKKLWSSPVKYAHNDSNLLFKKSFILNKNVFKFNSIKNYNFLLKNNKNKICKFNYIPIINYFNFITNNYFFTKIFLNNFFLYLSLNLQIPLTTNLTKKLINKNKIKNRNLLNFNLYLL